MRYIGTYLKYENLRFLFDLHSEGQGLNVSLDRYFIIQRQKLGKYIGNYGAEDTAFLTCYKSRPIHPILTQIGPGKTSQTWQTSNLYIHTAYFRYPNIQNMWLWPSRGADSVPYFEAKCHFVLSNVTPRAKTIFLQLLILRHKPKIYICTSKCFIGHFLFLRVASF